MDTGTVYVLESEGTAAGAGGARNAPQKVTELLSGRELNLNEVGAPSLASLATELFFGWARPSLRCLTFPAALLLMASPSSGVVHGAGGRRRALP